MAPRMPDDEAERLRALRALAILDTPPEAAFDDLTRLAAFVCGTPSAYLALVDADRQWFKSKAGWVLDETPREDAICAHTILEPDLLVVEDLALDPRFAANPLVMAEPRIRFYAGAPLRTPGGHALGTLCVVDREPRTLTPAQAEALRALGRQAAAQLELRRTAAERTAALRREELLVDILAHDLGNHLAAARTRLEALALRQPGAAEMAGAARVPLVRASRLVENALLLLRLQHGRVDTASVPLARIVEGSVAAVLPQAEARRVGVRVRGAEASGAAAGPLLGRALENLLANAVKWSPEGGEVAVRVQVLGGAVRLAVQDHGPGVPEARRSRLFARFEPGGGEGEGHGLGLAIARRIVEMEGGRIWYEDTPGGGSTFLLEVPAGTPGSELAVAARPQRA